MKRFLVVGSAVLVLSGCWDTTPFVKLTNLPGVYDVDPVEFGLYDLRVRQPLDHSDLEEGTFLQRVVIEHKGFDRPVVLVTEGYALGENHAAELAEMLGANQVRMEHRFMGDSVPEGSPWEYLTVVQSAEDAHTVVEILKPIYPDRKSVV